MYQRHLPPLGGSRSRRRQVGRATDRGQLTLGSRLLCPGAAAPHKPDRATRKDDYPPAVWFDKANADTEGPQKGVALEYDKYDSLLQHYYDQRGYDKRGIPTKDLLGKLGLSREAAEVEKYARLS